MEVVGVVGTWGEGVVVWFGSVWVLMLAVGVGKKSRSVPVMARGAAGFRAWDTGKVFGIPLPREGEDQGPSGQGGKGRTTVGGYGKAPEMSCSSPVDFVMEEEYRTRNKSYRCLVSGNTDKESVLVTDGV